MASPTTRLAEENAQVAYVQPTAPKVFGSGSNDRLEDFNSSSESKKVKKKKGGSSNIDNNNGETKGGAKAQKKKSSDKLEGSIDHVKIGMRDPQPPMAPPVLVEQSRGPRIASGGGVDSASSSFVSTWVQEQMNNNTTFTSPHNNSSSAAAVEEPLSPPPLGQVEGVGDQYSQQQQPPAVHSLIALTAAEDGGVTMSAAQAQHHYQSQQQFHPTQHQQSTAPQVLNGGEPTLPVVGSFSHQHDDQRGGGNTTLPLVGLTTSGDGRLDVQRTSALSANSLEGGDQSRSKLSIPAAIQIGPSMAGLTNLVANASEKRMSDSSLMGGFEGAETPIVVASPPPGARNTTAETLHTPPAPKPQPTHVALPPPGVIVEAGDSSPPQVLIAGGNQQHSHQHHHHQAEKTLAVSTSPPVVNNQSNQNLYYHNSASAHHHHYHQANLNDQSRRVGGAGGGMDGVSEYSNSRVGGNSRSETQASSSLKGKAEAQGLPYVAEDTSAKGRKAAIVSYEFSGGYGGGRNGGGAAYTTTQSTTRTSTLKSGAPSKRAGAAKYTAIASNHTRSIASASNVAIEMAVDNDDDDDAIGNQMREISSGYDATADPEGTRRRRAEGGGGHGTIMNLVQKIPFFVIVAVAMALPLLVLISLDLHQLRVSLDHLNFLNRHKPMIDAASKCDFDLMLERGMSSVRLAREGRDPSLIPVESEIDIRQYAIELTKQRQAVDQSCGEVRRLAIDDADGTFSGAYADELSLALAELQTTRFKIDANISMTATIARQFFTFDLIGKMSKLRLLAASEKSMQAAVPGIMQLQYMQEVYNQLGLCRAVGAQMLLFSNFSSMTVHSPGIHIEFFNCRSGFNTQNSLLRSVLNGPTPFDTSPSILPAVRLMDEMDPETSIGNTNVTTTEWFETFSRAFLTRELEPNYEAQIRGEVARSAIFVTVGIILSIICAAAVMRVQFLLMRRIKGSLAQSRRLNVTIAKFVPKSFLRMNGCQSILDIGPGQQTQVAVALLYSDIRNFGTISQGMSSEAIFVWLDGYMSRVAGITESFSGFVEKFLGDAVFSVFSSAGDAALCAIEMQKETDVMNVKADFTGVSQDAENKQREVDNDSYSSMGELMRPVDERRAGGGGNRPPSMPQQQQQYSSQHPHIPASGGEHASSSRPPRTVQIPTASAALASGFHQQQQQLSAGDNTTNNNNAFVDAVPAADPMQLLPNSSNDVNNLGNIQQHNAMSYRQQQSQQQPAPENSSIIRLLRTAVGIHFGVVSCGIMGDSHRLSPMLVSPAVNLPPRIQSLSRHYGSRILLTDATADHLDRGRFGIRKLGPVRLDGGEVGQFVLWELYQSDPHEVQLFKHQHRDKFERAMDLRSRGDRMEAARLLDAIRERGIHQGIQDRPLEVKIRHVADEGDSGVDAFTN